MLLPRLLSMVAAVALCSCGLGHTNAADADGSFNFADAASRGACPAGQPATGSPCPASFVGLCEYGSDADYICNVLVACSGGVWTQSPAASSNAAGATCPTPRDATCPASRTAIANGQACSGRMTCGYANSVCDCIPPSIIDGLDAASLSWACDTTSTPRPPVGSACASEGTTMDYGACDIPEGFALKCTGGTWQPTMMSCPL